MGALVTLAFANVLTAAAIIFAALSFATDHWIDITVRRSAMLEESVGGSDAQKTELQTNLKENPLYFSRNRGLFRTCYDGNETEFLDDRDDVVGDHCIPEKKYELSRREKTTDWGSDYDTLIQLIRCHFACMILTLILLVVGFVFGAMSCYRHRMPWFRIAGIMDFLSAFFLGAGMAFFHGYEYLEKNKIEQLEFYNMYRIIEVPGVSNPQHDLGHFTKWSYGYSYIIGWLGMAVAAIGAILFLVSAFKLAQRHRREKRPLPQDHHGYHTGRKNRGYDDFGGDYSSKYAGGYYPQPSVMPSSYPMAPSAYPDMTNFSGYGY